LRITKKLHPKRDIFNCNQSPLLPLIIGDKEIDLFIAALDEVLTEYLEPDAGIWHHPHQSRRQHRP
jgi:hypothetical protein